MSSVSDGSNKNVGKTSGREDTRSLCQDQNGSYLLLEAVHRFHRLVKEDPVDP